MEANYLEWEYGRLKEEQVARIGFRDNIIYLTLVATGAVWSFALSGTGHYAALLVVPFVNVVLGWTYIVNDQKILAIGKYIRTRLAADLAKGVATDAGTPFGWEIEHRRDVDRVQRKIIQLIVDVLTFAVSGASALVAFVVLGNLGRWLTVVLFGVEAVMLGILTWQFFKYADLSRDV